MLFSTYLLGVNSYDTREDCPDDNLTASWGGQASWVGEVVPSINCLDELSKVDLSDES